MDEHKNLRDERVALEVLGKSVILQISQERAKSVKVILGGADGTLIYIDWAGHIHKLPPEGPGDPEARRAVAAIVSGTQALVNLSQAGVSGVAA
jgi:hypothetical protein